MAHVLELGGRIGPYRIASVLGQGPKGAVYEAVDPQTQRRVALRALPAAVATLPSFSDANVAAIYDTFDHGGSPYLATEFVGGGPVVTRMPWRDATRLVISACRAVAAMHSAGLVHGTLSLANLLRTHDGVLKIADLGLAELAGTASPFLAPEQRFGQAADPRADEYALAAIWVALLTGTPPIDDVPNVRADAPDIPLRIEPILRRALATAPGDRYPNVATLQADLESLLKVDSTPLPLPKLPPPPRWRPQWNWMPRATAAFVVVFVATAAAIFAIMPREPAKSGRRDAESLQPPPSALPTFTNSIAMVLAKVPPGSFSMGELVRHDARPRRAYLTKGFAIGVYEVTQAQYSIVTGVNPSAFKGDNYPVEQVTWDDAIAFCKRLSERDDEMKEGRTYRLPTEAEWEYCCRAGTTTAFSFGATISSKQVNGREAGLGRTTAAGTFPPNAWGLYDMHGNVWEWCQDWYKIDYPEKAPAIDPQGPPTGQVRVTRGGSWADAPMACRSGFRNNAIAPDCKDGNVGFRVVCVTSRAN